jgi:hypothetical protein
MARFTKQEETAAETAAAVEGGDGKEPVSAEFPAIVPATARGTTE